FKGGGGSEYFGREGRYLRYKCLQYGLMTPPAPSSYRININDDTALSVFDLWCVIEAMWNKTSDQYDCDCPHRMETTPLEPCTPSAVLQRSGSRSSTAGK